MKIRAALLAILACASLAAARDWTKYPAIVEIDTTADVYAVGDPHSDWERLAGVLATAKVIESKPAEPNQVQWRAGKSVLVITGDLIDKGPPGSGAAGLGVITFLSALRTSASAAGGLVIVTMGNHEAEFLADPTAGKTKEFQKELKTNKMEPARVAACDGAVGEFLCNLPIGARVNDYFFSHGGNSGGQTVAGLNASIADDVNKSCFRAKALIDPNSILEARLNDGGPAGLPWIYDGNKKTDAQALLADYAAKLGVHHIVQGHQPGNVKFLDGPKRDAGTIFQRWGLLFLMDTGMSRGIEGSNSIGGALHITPKGVEVICAGGTRSMLWDAGANTPVAAMYCGK